MGLPCFEIGGFLPRLETGRIIFVQALPSYPCCPNVYNNKKLRVRGGGEKEERFLVFNIFYFWLKDFQIKGIIL
jgi:hypothetical protein